MRVVSILAALTLALVSALGLAACGGGGPSDLTLASTPTTVALPGTTATSVPATATSATAVPSYASLVAQAHVPRLAVYNTPDALRPSRQLPNPWLAVAGDPSTSTAQIFLVKAHRPDGWVQVLLPILPNGTLGWVRAADVTITQTAYRVRIALGARHVTVFSHGQVLYQGSVAVGTSQTPTPTGSYYLRVLLKAPEPGASYGPYAYGLSSNSKAISGFAGGDGEIGIHGNGNANPSILGHDVTHGCIRIANAEIKQLAGVLPLGTPVDIVS